MTLQIYETMFKYKNACLGKPSALCKSLWQIEKLKTIGISG